MQNHRRWALAVGVAVIVTPAIGHAKKPGLGDDHGYRTGTIVPSDANECAGVPNCVAVRVTNT